MQNNEKFNTIDCSLTIYNPFKSLLHTLLKHIIMKNISLHFLFFIAIAILVSSCSNEETINKNKPVKKIKYGTVIQTGGIEERSFNGVSTSATETQLSFRANGAIEELHVIVGQKVKKGQKLAQIDQKEMLLAVGTAQSSLNNAKAQYETALSANNRTKQLYQNGNVSLQDYERSKSNLANALSSFESAQKNYVIYASKLDYTSIVAPMDGIVSAVNASVNEFGQAGKPVIILSSDKQEDIEIEVGVPEKYINKVKQGDSVSVTIPSLNHTQNGTVTEIAYSSNGGANYSVTISLQGNQKNLRPGMPADVHFFFGNTKSGELLLIPVEAVGEDEKGNFAFVLNKSQKHFVAVKKAITISSLVSDPSLGDCFVVQSGVNRGDYVAVAGLRSLYDGRSVGLLKQ